LPKNGITRKLYKNIQGVNLNMRISQRGPALVLHQVFFLQQKLKIAPESRTVVNKLRGFSRMGY
jgi:hypothetical protein